jgi:Ca2+-binding EF-hand superfamily protein
VSFYDLFNKFDENKDGFITKEEWMKNIGQIIQLEER